MARHEVKVFDVEIRDTEDHNSDTMDADADVNVLTDELHPSQFHHFDNLRVYVEDDHDQAIDVAVQHVAPDDTNFSQPVDKKTIAVSAGGDSGTATFGTPIGRLRFNFTGISTAPTSGSCRCTVIANGRD